MRSDGLVVRPFLMRFAEPLPATRAEADALSQGNSTCGAAAGEHRIVVTRLDSKVTRVQHESTDEE